MPVRHILRRRYRQHLDVSAPRIYACQARAKVHINPEIFCNFAENMRSTKHRILITGANGQLGRAFVSSLDNDDSFDVHACGHSDLDIRDEKAVSQAITDFGIDILVNCAAYTAVDAAEDHPEEAYAVNHKAVAAIAYACNHLGVKLVHFSTDYVFDGQSRRPYLESDTTAPLNVYGQSKLAGETAALSICPDALIIRTAGVYAAWGHNFVRTIYSRLKDHKPLRVVADQLMSPTEATTLVDVVRDIIVSGQKSSGIFNFANNGEISWYDLATAIASIGRLDESSITPITMAEYPTKAARPAYSVLDTSLIRRTFGIRILDWQSALCRVVQQLQ